MTGGGEYGSNMNNRFVVHETMELHEITAFKTVCLTKSKTMPGLVTDPVLKTLLQEDAALTARQLQELDGLLSHAILEEVQA